MITACEKCKVKHQLNMSSMKGEKAKFTCQNCGHITIVEKSALVSSTSGNFQRSKKESTTSIEPLAGAPYTHPKISGLSIRTKITLFIVTLIITSLSTVGFIASNGGSKALSQQAMDHLGQISTQKAKEYNNVFNRLQNEIEGVAIYASQTFARNNIDNDLNFTILMPWNGSGYGYMEGEKSHEPEILALQRVGLSLQGLVKKNPYLQLGYMATENNIMVLDDEKIVGVIEAEDGYIPKKRPWYIDATKKGTTVWTQPYIDVNTKKLIVSCATPVYDNDKSLIGVVGFDVLLATIQKDIISLDIGYDSRAFLLDREGNLLAKPRSGSGAWNQTVKTDNALKTGNREFTATIREMMAGSSGVGTHTEDGNEIIIAYAPLPAVDASVGIVVSQKEVMKPASTMQKLIITVWVIVVCISICMGLLIGNSITKPINNLTMRADMISQGTMDLAEISNKRKDEIGVLIEAFNRLVTSLKIAISRDRR